MTQDCTKNVIRQRCCASGIHPLLVGDSKGHEVCLESQILQISDARCEMCLLASAHALPEAKNK